MVLSMHVDECTSTNELAKVCIREGLMETNAEILITTDYQTTGKGAGKNTWESARAMNLLFSLALKIPTTWLVDNIFYINIACSLSLHDLLHAHNITPLAIKWPNDICCGKQKIAGILAECKGTKKTQYIVLGVGLNVNQVSFSLPRATSMRGLMHRAYDRDQLFRDWQLFFKRRYHSLQTQAYASLKEAYLQRLYRINEWAYFALPDGAGLGKIIGITSAGALQLQTAQGVQIFREKEIVYL